jgi:hypothetical protein
VDVFLKEDVLKSELVACININCYPMSPIITISILSGVVLWAIYNVEVYSADERLIF